MGHVRALELKANLKRLDRHMRANAEKTEQQKNRVRAQISGLRERMVQVGRLVARLPSMFERQGVRSFPMLWRNACNLCRQQRGIC